MCAARMFSTEGQALPCSCSEPDCRSVARERVLRWRLPRRQCRLVDKSALTSVRVPISDACKSSFSVVAERPGGLEPACLEHVLTGRRCARLTSARAVWTRGACSPSQRQACSQYRTRISQNIPGISGCFHSARAWERLRPSRIRRGHLIPQRENFVHRQIWYPFSHFSRKRNPCGHAHIQPLLPAKAAG